MSLASLETNNKNNLKSFECDLFSFKDNLLASAIISVVSYAVPSLVWLKLYIHMIHM
jgi:hypothetical protein